MDGNAIKKRKSTSLKSQYLDILQRLSQVSSKKSELVDLTEKLYTLSSEIRNRSPCFLNADELRLIMDWKLARGKFRPQLKKLIASNSSDFVESTTKQAFLKSWPENLEILTRLKGVGPATATGGYFYALYFSHLDFKR